MFGELMELSGKTIADMPTVPEYCKNGRHGLCFNWLGVICPFGNCHVKAGHLPKNEVSDDLIHHFTSAVKTGVEKMLQGERGTNRGKRHRS